MAHSARVVEIDPCSDPRWDAYVRAHPRATANHLGAWARILKEVYRYRPVYLALEDGSGEIGGVMPLVHANGLLSGPRLTSMPALRWGGPLAATREAEARLLAAACERVRTGRARRLGMVTMAAGYEELVDRLAGKPAPPSWRLTLPRDVDEYRRRVKKRSKGCFYDIKKAWKSGLTVRDAGSTADLRVFFGLYLRTMKRHRALPRPFKKMSRASELLGPDVVRLFLAEFNGKPVAGLLCHFFNGMVEAMYNASDERHLQLHPNHALYDHAITTGIDEGLDYFDFGAAWPEESLAAFKRHWGTVPVERFGYVYPGDARLGAGARALTRARDKAPSSGRLLSWTWKRVPSPVTRLVGEVAWRYF